MLVLKKNLFPLRKVSTDFFFVPIEKKSLYLSFVTVLTSL